MEATLLEAADQLAGILVGGIATVGTACLLGRIALARSQAISGTLTRTEGWILSLATGSALLSLAVFALCSLQLVYDLTVALLAVTVLLCWLRWGRWRWEPAEPTTTAGDRAWRWLLLAPVAVYGALYVVHTLAPETRTDAMGYHLGLVQRYYRHHGFYAITTNVYAHISQGAEMLYLFAYALGRESAAKIVHLSFLAGTVGGILCFAKRLRAYPAGVFAAVAYFTCPVVIPDATSAYNDCALAFAAFSAFFVLALWWELRDSEWLVLLGVLTGFCFAIKYTGFVAVATVLAAAASVRLRSGSWPITARCLAFAGVPAAIVGLPWLVKSAVLTGNPLAPFFNRWFPNPYISVEWESAYRAAMRSYRAGPFDRWEQLLAAPYDLVEGMRYGGSVGWVVLLTPFTLLALRRRAGWALLTASGIWALPWLANAGARFLIPSLAFLVLAIGMALERVPGRARLPAVAALLAALCFTSWPSQRTRWYNADLWSVEGFPWRAALGLEPQKWHLARNVEHFHLANRIDQIAGKDTRILSFGNLPEAYFQAELLVSYQGLENQDLADAMLAAADPSEAPDSVLRIEWPSRPLQGIRVEQAARIATRSWKLSEIQPLSGGMPIGLGQGWRVQANPMPWHAGRAFDGNRFTHWNSREPPRPGMAVEALFGMNLILDGVDLVHPRAAADEQTELRVFGKADLGPWTEIKPSRTAFESRDLPAKAAASAAVRMLREHRIRYVVFFMDPSDEYYARSRVIASDPLAWGLRRVFVDRSAVLYEVILAAR